MQIGESKLIKWKTVGEKMPLFYVAQSLETMRPVAKRLGLTWIRTATDPGSGRGRVGLFDPLVCWVLATVYHWPRTMPVGLDCEEHALEDAAHAMQSCRFMAQEMWGGKASDELVERLAYYLFVIDPRWGLEIRALDRILLNGEVLELTLDGPLLETLLRAYKATIISNALQRDVPVWDVPLASDRDYGDLRHEHTDTVYEALTEAGLYDADLDDLIALPQGWSSRREDT